MIACGQESLSVVLTAESPEVETVLREADARWEAAGVDPDRIIIGPGGAPVTVTYIGETGDGNIILGETNTVGRGGEYTRTKWMKLSSLDLAGAMHEMGHALGIGAASVVSHPIDGSDCEGGFDVRPLMCPHIGNHITEKDLTAACEAGPCKDFIPE